MSQKSSGSKLPTKVSKPTTLPTRPPAIGGSTAAPPRTFSPSTAASTGVRSDVSDTLAQSTEDFIIGEQVWVNGTKSGYIQFLGETQFAPGQWAGIVLDEPLGKNDGSVGGICYFQCEPNRGVFARPYRLSRFPASPSSSANGTLQSSLRRASTSQSLGSTTRLSGSSPAGSVKNATTPPGGSSNTSPMDGVIAIGDRVIVNAASGTKIGTLRYLGNAEFAAGQWAGIELDEPQGKNDGSVAGKRYFECKMKYGLFAPVHKLSKAGKGPGSTRVSRLCLGTGLPLHRRAGSQESLNSSISSTSSAARGGRVRLGVTSLTSPQRASRRTVPNITATNNALQEALKEKEEHIEQLLRERDLERAEVARAAAQVDKAEQELTAFQTDHKRFAEETEITVSQLKQLLEKAESEKKEVLAQLDDEKRKVEDLQFRIEEESINKVDLESQSEQQREKLEELEKLLEEHQLSRSLNSSSNLENSGTDLVSWHKEEVEKLKQTLSKSEEKIKSLEELRASENAAVKELKAEIVHKDETILQLEASLESRKREVSDLQKRLTELGENLEQSKVRQEKHLQIIDDLNVKVAHAEASSSRLDEELHTVKTCLAGAEQKLETSEQKMKEFLHQKKELEDQVVELIRTSGDNSDQRNLLNQELKEKQGKVEELQAKLKTCSQEIEELKETVNSLHNRNKQEFDKTRNEHNEEVQVLKAKIKTQHEELQKAQENISELTNTLAGQEHLVSIKEAEREELWQQLEKSKSQVTQSQAELKELQLCMESLQTQTSTSTKALEIKIHQLQNEIKQVHMDKEELLHQYQASEETRVKLEKNLEQIMKEKQEHQATVSDRDVQVAQLKAEVERLQTEFAKHREELQQKIAETELESKTMQDLHNQFNLQQDTISKLQKELVRVEAERDELYREVLTLRGIQEERNQMENRSANLEQELEDFKQRESKLVTDFNKERDLLKKMVDSTQSLLKQQGDDIIKKDQELTVLQEQNFQLQNSKILLQDVEQEKKQLEKKVVEIQMALANLQSNDKIEGSEFKKTQEDNKALEKQMEFLNSVIVDLQRKNDELKSKLKILETGEALDGGDLKLNGINAVIPPRLFCDICDMFDLHDTEDCPQQVMDEKVLHSQHHGKRNQERPYCEDCEVFGHWQTECDSNETF